MTGEDSGTIVRVKARQSLNAGGKRVLAASVSLLLVLGCAGEDTPAPWSGGDFPLPDGSVLSISAKGALTLSRDGKLLVELGGAQAFEVGRYDEAVQDLFGMWWMERIDEVRVPLALDGKPVVVGDAVRFRLRRDQDVVTVTVSPRREGATTIALEPNTTEDGAMLSLPFDCTPDASFFGFGEQYAGRDLRGAAFPLFVSEQGIGRDGPEQGVSVTGNLHTTYYPMPYFLDARGSGVLVRSDQRVSVDLCARDEAVAFIEVERLEPVELVVFHGPTPKDVVRQLGDEVGRAPAPPAWAYGPWIAAQGGRDVVLGVADALEQADIPVTAIWSQDWTGARANVGGGYGVQYRWRADEELYPDLAGMIADLHQRDIRFLGYANPFVVTNLEHFAEMEQANLLIRDADGKAIVHGSPAFDASHPDLSRPEARAYVKGFLRKMVTELGMDGWMADFGEWVPLNVVPADGSHPRAFHNRYPEAWHRLSREVMDEVRPDGDYAVFSRSGWTGDQSVAQIVWVGDQEATFSPTDGLPTVVPAMLDLGLAAVPFVTHDIAGFSGGPSTKELFMRWTELGAFTPIFRTHEGNERDSNWAWDADPETTAHFRRFARIHQLLVPELQALAQLASESSLPLVRHLMLEFPSDPGSRMVSDQFMLGSSLLVAPVVSSGATSRSVVLPPGTWYHVWTGATHEGPATVTIDAPIGSPPVFSLGEDRPDLRGVQ